VLEQRLQETKTVRLWAPVHTRGHYYIFSS